MKPNATLQNYEQKRAELKAANANLLGVYMRQKEVELDSFLGELKKEFKQNCGDLGGMPLNCQSAVSSRLYRFCSRLPKGADLHVHDMALLPAKELFDLLLDCEGFYINADRLSYDLKYSESAAPDGYISFAESIKSGFYTKDELVKNWTVLCAEDSGKNIWECFENLFCRHADLSDNVPFAAKYYRRAFRYYCEKNIYHVEIHMMLTESIEQSAEYLKAVRDAYYEVKREYPYFTVKVIGAGVKADSTDIELTKRCFLNTSYAKETVKDESGEDTADFIIGFDLVNEEDTSLPLYKFAPMLLKMKKQFPDMGLYVHGGESIDAGNENLIDAYLLGADRVGHGLNLYRYPDLHSKYAEAEICLEVCPISNIALGYTKDLRNHPATEYLRTGVPLSLCSDDPAYMENETLTDDFFAAVLAWDLRLAEIKQLAINSVMYSGLSKKEKSAAIKNYTKKWDLFVDEILKKGI